MYIIYDCFKKENIRIYKVFEDFPFIEYLSRDDINTGGFYMITTEERGIKN
jgi:hypothetical protein